MGWARVMERLADQARDLERRSAREQPSRYAWKLSEEAANIRAALQRVEELERALKSADESIERNKLDRDEWRDTAQKVVEALTTWQQHYAYRRSVESALAAYEKGQIALAAAKGEPLCDGSCGAKPDRPHRHFMAKGE